MKAPQIIQMKKNEALNQIKAIINSVSERNYYDFESSMERKYCDIECVINKLNEDIKKIKADAKQK